jgi:2-deoxy-D-gluconate 3-dehydrogenase
MANIYQNTPFDLEGKSCFLAGTGLLGSEFALALAEAGARLFLADSDRERLAKAESALRGKNPQAEILSSVMDITNPASVNSAVAECVSRSGRIDVLLNAAAVDPKCASLEKDLPDFTAFTSTSLESWQLSLNVNLTGAFLLTQAVCKEMEKTGEGSIIFLGSQYGLVGPDQRIYRSGNRQSAHKPAAYSVTKAGLLGFTKFLAAYYRNTKIRVNMLTPAGVFNDHSDEFAGQYSEKTVLGRMSKKDEFKGAVLFLASNASSYMTGANLLMDGGWTAI